MEKLLVSINDREYRCEVPQTDEEYRDGLSRREFLAPDEGMLFNFMDRTTVPQMHMKDTVIPLDMIGIDMDGTVVTVVTPEPESEALIPFRGCIFVLEVNAGSGVKPGDDFEVDEDVDLDKYVMKVLAPDGTAQGLLQGGERIFSRVSTRMLIARAKKAYAHKDDKELYEKDCRKLGKYVFKELYAQDHRESQYVSLPDKKD